MLSSTSASLLVDGLPDRRRGGYQQRGQGARKRSRSDASTGAAGEERSALEGGAPAPRFGELAVEEGGLDGQLQAGRNDDEPWLAQVSA